MVVWIICWSEFNRRCFFFKPPESPATPKYGINYCRTLIHVVEMRSHKSPESMHAKDTCQTTRIRRIWPVFTVSRTLLVLYLRRRIEGGQSEALIFRQQQRNKGNGIFTGKGLSSLRAGIANRGLTPTIRMDRSPHRDTIDCQDGTNGVSVAIVDKPLRADGEARRSLCGLEPSWGPPCRVRYTTTAVKYHDGSR